MKHVHAETIIELAADMDKLVQMRRRDKADGWITFDQLRDQMDWLVNLDDSFETRIKPQPKAIRWMNIYVTGYPGWPHATRQAADAEVNKNVQRICTVEVRDDGTAHLHKVEA